MFLFLLQILFIFQVDFVFLDCLVTRNYARFRRSNVVVSAAAPFPKLRTVGGDEVDSEEAFPFMVSILKRGRLIGGGVILERHWILSAAHLFIDKAGISTFLWVFWAIRSFFKLKPPFFPPKP